MSKLFIVAMLLLIGVAMASAVFAQEVVPGNPTCPDNMFGFKVEPVVSGDYGDGFFSVHLDVNDPYFNWTSSIGVDIVIVKGGDNALLYYGDEMTGGNDYHAPINGNTGQPFGLSHVEFCYDITVSVSKDAHTTFVRTYLWDIAKSVDPTQLNMYTGQSGDAHYTVTVTQTGFQDSDWAVYGGISVYNPGPISATITEVSDNLAPVDCGVSFPYELGMGQTLNCTYAGPLGDGSNRTNTATASTSGKIGGGSGNADVVFGDPTTVVLGTVHVTDTNGQGWDFGGSGNQQYAKTFTCDQDAGGHDNTATIDETGQNASAHVDVTCVPPPTPTDTPTPPPPTETPTPPPPSAEWCSPGYWKNHPESWPVSQDLKYNDLFNPDLSGNPTIWQVIRNPQRWGGPATNKVADYLSQQAGLNFTGERVDNCPLN